MSGDPSSILMQVIPTESRIKRLRGHTGISFFAAVVDADCAVAENKFQP